jgi:hypothetical protein
MWYDFAYNSTFWLVLAAIMLFGYGLVRSLIKRIPVLGGINRRMWVIIAIVGFLVTSGALGTVFGTAQTASLAGTGYTITDIQVTTAFTNESSSATDLTENANVDDLLDVRMTDADVDETATSEEVQTGVLTVTRSGNLDPSSCPVRTVMPPDYADEAGDDGRRYNILEKTTVGEWEAYFEVNDGGAVITDEKDHASLTFTDGASTATLGVMLEIDEEGHDALNQYSYKDVILDICGKPFTFRIHRMD